MDSNDQIFWLSLVSMTFAFAGLCVRYCYKLRCSSIDCCGFNIQRDIVTEDIEAFNRYRRRIENNDDTTSIRTDTTRQAFQQQYSNYHFMNSPRNTQLQNANINLGSALADNGMPIVNIHGAEQM